MMIMGFNEENIIRKRVKFRCERWEDCTRASVITKIAQYTSLIRQSYI